MLAAAAAVRFMTIGGATTVQATHAKFTQPYQCYIASISSHAGHVTFLRLSAMGIIGVRYSWYYYVLLVAHDSLEHPYSGTLFSVIVTHLTQQGIIGFKKCKALI